MQLQGFNQVCTFWVMTGHDLLHWDREISLTFSSRRRLLRTIFSHFISFKDKLMKPDIWTPEMFNFVEEWLFISFWLLKGSRLKTYWSALVSRHRYFKSNHYLSTVATWWQNCHIAIGGQNWFLIVD